MSVYEFYIWVLVDTKFFEMSYFLIFLENCEIQLNFVFNWSQTDSHANTIINLQNAVFKCKFDRLLWMFSVTIAYYVILKITVFRYFWKIHKFSIFIWFQVVSYEKASQKTCQIMTSNVIFVINCEFYNIICVTWHSIFWNFYFF